MFSGVEHVVRHVLGPNSDKGSKVQPPLLYISDDFINLFFIYHDSIIFNVYEKNKIYLFIMVSYSLIFILIFIIILILSILIFLVV